MVTVRLQCVSKISGILTGFLIKMSEVFFTFVCVFCQLGILRDLGLRSVIFVTVEKRIFITFIIKIRGGRGVALVKDISQFKKIKIEKKIKTL